MAEKCWVCLVGNNSNLDSTRSLMACYLGFNRMATAERRGHELADRAVGVCDAVEPLLTRDYDVVL
jgi:hypothetical protein